MSASEERCPTPSSSAVAAGDKWRDSIDRSYCFLVEQMMSEFGLVDKLYQSKTISNGEKNSIKAKTTTQDKNRTLLDYIINKNAHSQLIDALEKSNQRHLINYLETDGQYLEEFNGVWPLTEEISIIDDNYEELVDLIDVCDLLCRLYETGVISRRQMEYISSKQTSYEKNEALLEIIRRSSLNSFNQTIRCLHASNQSHVAEVLEKGGILVSVVTYLDGGEEQEGATGVEAEIVAQISSCLGDQRTPAQCNRIWDQVMQLRLSGAKRIHSIAVYFLCLRSTEVDRLEAMASDERLKDVLETLYTELTEAPQRINIKLKWTTTVFARCRKMITEINEKKLTMRQLKLTTMEDLPSEAFDVILQKCYLKNTHKLDIISVLSLVSFSWFRRATRKSFKEEVLSEFARQNRRSTISLFYMNNRQYVGQTIQLRSVMKILRSRDFPDYEVTTVTTQRIQLSRKRRNRLQQLNVELLMNIFGNYIGGGQRLLILCLQRTDQKTLAKVFQNGGAVVSVRISSPYARNRTVWIEELVEQINDLKRNRCSCSEQMMEFIERLNENDMELLNAAADVDAVVWIWCKSQIALKKLQELIEFDTQVDFFCGLFRESPELVERKNVNLDADQLKREMVWFKTFVKHVTEIEGLRKHNQLIVKKKVFGIAKLSGRIYVLCQETVDDAPNSSIMLQVFSNGYPSRCTLLTVRVFRIVLQINPLDMGSSEATNRLYILDTSGIRKVRHILSDNDYQAIVWLKFEEDFRPKTLSVSTAGRLLLVGRRSEDIQSNAVLKTYGVDSNLLFTIDLSDEIQNSLHAVETSKGNFIIFHKVWRNTMTTTFEDDSPSENSEYVYMVEKKREWHAEDLNRQEFSAVSEVGSDGAIIRCFVLRNEEINSPSFSEEQLEGYLFVDSQDRVFVADAANGRVILLDSNLQLDGILIPLKSGRNKEPIIRNPRRLFYDEETDQLIVGGDEVHACALGLHPLPLDIKGSKLTRKA